MYSFYCMYKDVYVNKLFNVVNIYNENFDTSVRSICRTYSDFYFKN